MVLTTIAEAHTEGIPFDVDGVVVPYRQIEIAAQVSGRIAFKDENCRVGRSVKEGDLLISIEPHDYELEVTRLVEEQKQADAMIRELELEIVTAENQIDLTNQQLEIDARTLERNVRLSTTNAASQTELDAARRAELTTRNALQSLKDNRNLLKQRLVRMDSGKALVEANLQKARLALARTEIRAPLDGIVVNETVEEDGYIQVGNTLISIQDTSELDVTCKLHMRQMHWLWQSNELESAIDNDSSANGEDSADQTVSLVDERAYDFPSTPATIIYDLGSASYRWHGMLNRYDGAGIDSQTRMIPCRVHVDHPTEVNVTGEDEQDLARTKPPTLMTGMFVTVEVMATPPIALVRIPQEAIRPGDIVWTVVDGKLKSKAVRIASSQSDSILAYQQDDGLQVGDKVVLSPLATPVDGLAVQEAGER